LRVQADAAARAQRAQGFRGTQFFAFLEGLFRRLLLCFHLIPPLRGTAGKRSRLIAHRALTLDKNLANGQAKGGHGKVALDPC
jgi:hypothetical protein